MIKIREAFKKGRPITGKEALGLLSSLVFQIIYGVFAIGLIGYFINVLLYKLGSNEAFQMATISGILGGLVLSGGLIRGKLPSGTGLRRAGIGFIASTLGFILFGLYAPLLDKLPEGELSFKFSELAFQAGFIIGVIGFSFATACLVFLIPRLWKRDDHIES